MATHVPPSEALPFPTAYAAYPHGTALEAISFNADDALPLSFLRLRPDPNAECDRGPVILVPGAGVRANLFCPPLPETLPQMLAKAGYDVFLMNWRASIDLPPVEYYLDDAAYYDFPAAIREIRKITGAAKVKAVVHCQGSCAFMMSIAAGKLPDVSVVVANSSALHPTLPLGARLKLPVALAALPKSVKWFNPQWGINAPRFWPKVIDWAVRAFHHECHNAVCKHSSFVYGFGFPTLWRHENLDEPTHEWIRGEFAHVPRTLFAQLSASQGKNGLRAQRSYPDWPEEFAAAPPKTNARFAFITGAENKTFDPKAVKRTFEFFMSKPGRRDHTYRTFHGIGHLDMFLGITSAAKVFPYILEQLALDEGTPGDA